MSDPDITPRPQRPISMSTAHGQRATEYSSIPLHRHHQPSPHKSFKRDSYYLARPPKTNSTTLALQLQRVTNHGTNAFPVFDIKKNQPPIRRFLKKVRSFNDAVSVIIPPAPHYLHHNHHHHHIHHQEDSPSRRSSLQLPVSPYSIVSDPTPSPSTSTSASTYSLYDRDTPKEPVAQFSKHGISFSQRTTPLLSRHTRLDRQDPSALQDTSSIAGPVSWILVEERNTYRVIDLGSNTLIGKWKLRSTLSSGSRRRSLNHSASIMSPIEDRTSPLGMAAVSYFSQSHTFAPFFSGEAANFSPEADPDKLTWCFIVKGTVVATLKGYELSIVQQQPLESGVSGLNALMSTAFLDEFTKALRQKQQAKAMAASGASTASLASVMEEANNDRGASSTSTSGSRNSNVFRRSSLHKSCRRHTLSVMTFASSSPRQSAEFSQHQHHPRPPTLESPVDSSAFSFLRLKFSDGIAMTAMALMLNLDDRLQALSLSEDAEQEQQEQESTDGYQGTRVRASSGSSGSPKRMSRKVLPPTPPPEPEREQVLAVELEQTAKPEMISKKEASPRRKYSIRLPRFLKIKALHA